MNLIVVLKFWWEFPLAKYYVTDSRFDVYAMYHHNIEILILLATDMNDETYEETENSSNDEDIDPTLELRHPKPKLSLQQNSFTSIFTKLQTGLTSKTNSFDNNNQSPTINGETVPFRNSGKKKRQWRKAFAQRRKTFTG